MKVVKEAMTRRLEQRRSSLQEHIERLDMMLKDAEREVDIKS
jgi:hypothetical protein